jgi:hypothetical protein
MTTPATPGREPSSVVEIIQPRCVNVYGSSPCTATGTPKCYNTYSTCTDKGNYNGTGSIAWRFTMDNTYVEDFGDFSDPDNIKTNGIPSLASVSTVANKINPGAVRDGDSPFGVTGKININFNEIEWDDHVGDPYLADRPGYVANKMLPVKAGYWQLFNARNELLNDINVVVYDGYHGQPLSERRQRLAFLENVNGPSSDGGVTVTAVDPLKVVNDDKTQYPPVSDISLAVDITIDQTSGVQVFGDSGDLDRVLGDDGTKLIELGDEVIQYTGYADDGSNLYTLSGVTRAVFGEADNHSIDDKMQRCANFVNSKPWVVAETLLTYETRIPASFVPTAAWEAECSRYIPSSRVNRLLHSPTGVRKLVGELSQQCLFYIWWEAYDSEIKLLTIRPPSEAVYTLTDDANIIDSVAVTAKSEERLTQVVVYYAKIDQLGKDEEDNFRRKYRAIDTDVEGAGISPIIKTVFAEWITSRSMAAQLAVRLLLRYKKTPRFLKIQIDAKDREISVGDLADVFTRYLVTTEGAIDTKRFQVISAQEIAAGHLYVLDLQTYEYIGRFGQYMADGSPVYASASDAQKETGGFYANSDGEMPDGSEGYLYQ